MSDLRFALADSLQHFRIVLSFLLGFECFTFGNRFPDHFFLTLCLLINGFFPFELFLFRCGNGHRNHFLFRLATPSSRRTTTSSTSSTGGTWLSLH